MTLGSYVTLVGGGVAGIGRVPCIPDERSIWVVFYLPLHQLIVTDGKNVTEFPVILMYLHYQITRDMAIQSLIGRCSDWKLHSAPLPG